MKTFFILFTLVAVAELTGCRSTNENNLNNSNSNGMTVNTNMPPQNSLGNMNGAPIP